MRLQAHTRSGRALFVAAGLTLLAGGALAWTGFRALVERERSVETHYTATTVLVRDRLVAELARLESELRSDLTRAAADFHDRAAARNWLARLTKERPWLGGPVLFDGAGGLLSLDLDAGWGTPMASRSSQSGFTALVRQAEADEFAGGDLRGALNRYRHAHSRASSVSARVLTHMRIGRVLYKMGRYDAGLEQYRTVVAVAGDLVGPNGIPYAVSALRQMTDGFAALHRTADHRSAERQLRDYILEHPWNLADGYEYHLALALTLEGARESTPVSTIRRVQDGIGRIAWIRRELLPRVLSDITGSSPGSAPRRLTATREGAPAVIGWMVAPADGARDIGLAYELQAAYLAGPLLQQVLRTVDLGSDLSVAVLDAPNSRSVLVHADLDVLPGWRVGLFHRRGQSIPQLVARERFIYGAFISGMILVLIAGVALTARASAREAELARLRTDFVASVSHELKTPLALIRMFGETLDSDIVIGEPQRREFCGVIRRESERLSHLIENVLDVARIDAGTKQYALQVADLVAITREAVDAYRPFFERQGFRVETVLPPAPIRLAVDRDAVVQALINLFHNAVKYSADVKHVTVSVAARGGEVRLAVADRGIGIPGAQIPRIFHRYYRVPANGGRAPAGSGLGLSLVAHAMAAHGGRVDVESTPGAGSVFTLVFPAPSGRAEARP